jgi:hypothetical protein
MQHIFFCRQVGAAQQGKSLKMTAEAVKGETGKNGARSGDAFCNSYLNT